MPPELLYFLARLGVGGVGGLLQGLLGTSEGQKQALANQNEQQRLLDSVARLRNPDYAGVIDAASRQLTQTLDSTKNPGGGVGKSRENTIGANIAANLAQFILQDTNNREAQAANILSSDVFKARSPDSYNPGLDAFLGLISGAGGGAASALGNLFEAGTFDKKGGVPASSSFDFGVKNPLTTGLTAPTNQLDYTALLDLLNGKGQGGGFNFGNFNFNNPLLSFLQ